MLIYDPSDKFLMRVRMKVRNFPLELKHRSFTAMHVDYSESDLWHKRMGHFNLKALKYASQNQLVTDLPSVINCNNVCEECQLRMMNRQPFPKEQTWRATLKLELMHTDICGSMRTTSVSDNKYFILFIDDFTRMYWVIS